MAILSDKRLVKLNACAPQLAKFRRLFGAWAEVDEYNVGRAVDDHLSLLWALKNLLSGAFLEAALSAYFDFAANIMECQKEQALYNLWSETGEAEDYDAWRKSSDEKLAALRNYRIAVFVKYYNLEHDK